MCNCARCGVGMQKEDVNYIFRLDLSSVVLCDECFGNHLDMLDDEDYAKDYYIMGKTFK